MRRLLVLLLACLLAQAVVATDVAIGSPSAHPLGRGEHILGGHPQAPALRGAPIPFRREESEFWGTPPTPRPAGLAWDSLSDYSGTVGVGAAPALLGDRQPNDPLYQSQADYLQAIDAPAAWDIQTGDPNVIVAVLDSGVDIAHPDLSANIWTNANAGPNDGNNCGNDLNGCNFVDGQDVDPSCQGASTAEAPNPDVTPDFWHGTFVAGEIGAQGDNQIGVTGVDWNISLMVVRVGDCTGPDPDSVAQGILYAARNGARVINMSFGLSPGSDNVCHEPSPAVAAAVQQAHDVYGAVLVAPTGNEAAPNAFHGCVEYPAAYPQVIAVGASEPDGSRAPFSQYGPEVAVAAPGVGIISTVTPPAGQDQDPSALYRLANGTSFAAPLVAGEAALLISQNHLLSADQVRSLIEAGANPVDAGDTPNWAGAGIVDLAASLRLVPAAFSGSVFASGGSAPVPDGTPVEARIGSAVCGSGQTATTNGQAQYTVFVPPFASAQGCGLPGAIVEFSVGGVRAGAAVWRPVDIHLDLDTGR